MNFASVPAGATIFLDANTLIYHFSKHAQYGAACTQLVKRIELQQLQGFTSAHVLSDVVHRLMTLEAAGLPGWTYKGIVTRLRKHHAVIPKLTVFPQAITGPSHKHCRAGAASACEARRTGHFSNPKSQIRNPSITIKRRFRRLSPIH
jgi:predicted nucleic acid-binding protein